MRTTNLKGWMIDIIYSILSALIYTALYAMLLLFEPGPGFQNSLVANFAVQDLLVLAILFLIAGSILGSIIYGALIFIVSILGINKDDSFLFVFGWVVSIFVILYFSVACGLVSIGVF